MPIEITQKTITSAKADAAKGRVDITDSKSFGLALRGGPKGLLWQHRVQIDGTAHRLKLGAVDRWKIEEARGIANAATDHARTFGVPPDEDWLQAHLVKIGKLAPPAPEEDPKITAFPSFAIAREEYLEDLGRRNRKATVDSYRGFLCMKEVQALDERRLPTITRDEIVAIIIAVHASGRESSSENLTRTIRAFFNWLGSDGRRSRYGVATGLLHGIRAPERSIDEDAEEDEDDGGGYVPTITELARIIAVARSGALPPLVGCAVEFTCWTVQRRRAITECRLPDLMEIGDGTEGLWRVPAPSRKRRTKGGAKKRPHVIPLPPPAWDCVLRAAKLATERDPNTKYLFPAKRPRRKGDPIGHMHVSTLTHAFIDIPDCGASPHDVRRTMGTHGEAILGLMRTETKAILDHAEKPISSKIINRTSGSGTDDVTGIHYSLHDGTHHTWPIMRTWCAALEAEVKTAVAELEPLDELLKKLADRSYRVSAPPINMWTGEVTQAAAAEGKKPFRPLREESVDEDA